MNPRVLAACCVMVLLVVASRSDAHVFLDHAAPAVGSTVHRSPAVVRLWFTQEIEPAFSTIKLVDQKGNVVAQADSAVDAGDRTLLRLAVPPLPAGTYRVLWRVLSLDSHVTEGDFTFDVAP